LRGEKFNSLKDTNSSIDNKAIENALRAQLKINRHEINNKLVPFNDAYKCLIGSNNKCKDFNKTLKESHYSRDASDFKKEPALASLATLYNCLSSVSNSLEENNGKVYEALVGTALSLTPMVAVSAVRLAATTAKLAKDAAIVARAENVINQANIGSGIVYGGQLSKESYEQCTRAEKEFESLGGHKLKFSCENIENILIHKANNTACATDAIIGATTSAIPIAFPAALKLANHVKYKSAHSKMLQTIDRSIQALVVKNDLTFITYPSSESGLLWLSRGVATTKSSDITLKTVKGDSIFAGMITEENNSINRKRFSDLQYLAEIKRTIGLQKAQKYTLAPLTYDGKTAVKKLSKDTGKWEEKWLSASEIKAVHPNEIIVPRVLVDKITNKYVVGDLDGLLVADKSSDISKWDQIHFVEKWGPGHSKEHFEIAEEINKNFANKTGMSHESVPLIRHSFTHSWDNVEDIGFPLVGYSRNGKMIINDLPELWTYLLKQNNEGFKIRANCRWALPIELEMRKSIQAFRTHCSE
jgi:hypothetical protein